MATTDPYKFYFGNGIIQALPQTAQNDSQFQAASIDQVNAEIAKWSVPQYANDAWSQNYVRGLQGFLPIVQGQGNTQQLPNVPTYVTDNGVLTTQENLDKTAKDQAAVQVGIEKNIGTTNKPLYVASGTAPTGPLQTDTPYTPKNVYINQNYPGGIPNEQMTPTSPQPQIPIVTPPTAPGNVYSVVKGDTLSKIASQHGVSLQDLEKANPQIKNFNLIYPGQGVNIPQAGTANKPPDTADQANKLQDTTYSGLNSQNPNGLPNDISQIQSQINDINNAGNSNDPNSLIPDGSSGNEFQSIISDLKNALHQFESAKPQNLSDYFNQQMTELGIPGLQTELVNYQNIMNGTESDIRTEIASAGGIATESQIQGLVAERNNKILLKANATSNLLQTKVDYLNQLVGLKKEDISNYMSRFDKITGVEEKLGALETAYDNAQWRKTYQYQLLQQKNETNALKMIDEMNKYGGLAHADASTLKWLSDNSGIPIDVLKQAGNNAGKAEDLKLLTMQQKLSTNNGFGSVDNIAKAVINGLIAPSELPGFGVNSLRSQVLNKIYSTNPNFDTRQADSSFSFQKSTKTQTTEYAAQAAISASQIIKDLSNQVDRGDIQPINQAELIFKSKSGDVNTAKFLSAVKELGDEYGAVFGQGSATDFKAQLGLAILDPSWSPDQFNGIVDTSVQLIQNRLDAMKQQGTPSSIGNDTYNSVQNSDGTSTNPSSNTLDYLNSLGLP